MSSIIFRIYEPQRSIFAGPKPAPAQGHTPTFNGTSASTSSITSEPSVHLLMTRSDGADDSSPDALGVVFQ